MIEVFKTDVGTQKQAGKILTQLSIKYPSAKINFDLDDCDKILRIESETKITQSIIKLLQDKGFYCEELQG